jgi:hypothetical protein
MNRLARWAGLAVACGVAVASPARAGDIDFVRVHVPAAGLQQVPLEGGRYLPMPLTDFENAVARLGPGRWPTRQPVATEASYRLRLDPDGGLAGTLEFQIAAAAELSSQIPLGEVSASDGTIVTAEGSGAASIFCLADGGLALQTSGPGRYSCGIRLPPAAGNVVRLPLVPALVTTVDVDVPAAVRPIAVGDAATATLIEPVAERSGSWRIVRGPVGPGRVLSLVFWDGRGLPAPVRAWNGVTARGRQAEVVARIEPAAPWTPDRLELSAPSPLVVTSATAAGAELPWTRVGDGIVVTPPDRLVGSQEAIVFAAVMPVAIGDPMVVPLIRPAPARWAGCGARLVVDPSLAVQRVELSEVVAVTAEVAARWPLPAPVSRSLAAGLEPALVHLEHQTPTADASVVLGPREASLETARVTTVDISPGTVLGRTTAEVRVVAGQLFGITADIAADWFIDSVEAIDSPRGRDGDAPAAAGRPLEWRVVRSPQGSELRIGLPDAASPGRGVSLLVTGHRSGLPLGAEFSSDDIDMVRFPAETAMLEFQVGPTAVLEAAGQPLGVDPLPERLAPLAALASPRARIAAGERAPAVRARLVRRRPPVEAEVRVDLVARDERLAETFTFTCRPVAGELDAVVVHFSEPVGKGLEWAMADPLAGSLSAQLLALTDPTRGDLRTEAAVAESWLVELRPATAAAVTFRAARTVRLEAPVPLPLAWVEAAETPGGTIAIRGEAGQRPEVQNRALPELPPGADAAPGTVELAYGAPRTLAGTEPAASVLPPSVTAAARAWAWRQATICWCHESGSFAWETSLEVENQGRESVTITIPPGLKIEEAVVDDEPVAAVSSGADTAGLVVPLPRTGGRTSLVVRGVGRRDDRLGWWRIGNVACGVDMPVLERAVQLMLPPGLVTTMPADGRDWLDRLFGGGIGGAAEASVVQRGFHAVALSDAKATSAGPLVIRRRLLWSLAIGAGSVAALATMLVARRSGPAAVAACCIGAVAALWCPVPWDIVARTTLWGSIAGSWAATRWRPSPRTAVAILVALAMAGPDMPSAHAAEDSPLRVFITPGPDGGTALVPEPLFRRLSTATLGPPALRVLASEIVSPAAGADGPWRLALELEADPGGLLAIDQTGSDVSWGRVLDKPPGLDVSFAGQGRVARVATAVPGRHRLTLELVPEPTRTGAVEQTIVNLPPAPRATLRIDGPAVATGRRAAWQCDRAGPAGGWLPAVGTGVFDVATAARARLVRPVDPRATLAARLDAAVSFNDIAWRSDECRVTASFDVGAEATIVRQLIVLADPRLESVASVGGGPALRPLGGGRHLVEIPEPRVGLRRIAVEFRMALADPVGVFDVPFAWLEDVETDVRTARLRPEPGLDATAELPAGTAPVRPRLEDGVATTAVWRSDALANEGVASAEVRPRITVRRQPRRPRASQNLLVSLSEDHIGLRLRYQVDALDAPLVEIPVQLPPAAIIDEVALTRQRSGDDADRSRQRVDLVWSRTAADRIVAVVQRPETGPFRFELDARLPIRPATSGRLPVARIVDPGLPLEVRWQTAPGLGLTVTDPARPGHPLVRDRLELAPAQPVPAYTLTRAETPPLPAPASDVAERPAAISPPAEASVPLTTIDLAIDASGRAWGLARFDLLVREPLVTVRVPPGLRLFDLRVDGREVTATPLGGNAWQIRLHDVGWPRSLVAVIAGGVGGWLADGEPIRLEPPRLEGLPAAAVAWSLRTPSGFALRVSEPARTLDEEAFSVWMRQARTRIDDAFAAAIGTAAGGHGRRLDAFAYGVRAGAGPAGERAWYEAWRGSASSESQRVRIVASEDGTVTLRAVPIGVASAAALRGLVTAVILGGGAALWLAARRFPRVWSVVMPRLSRWWWLACGGAWLLLLEPPLPGLVMAALGIWLALPPPAGERGSGSTPAGDDSTLTFAGG